MLFFFILDKSLTSLSKIINNGDVYFVFGAFRSFVGTNRVLECVHVAKTTQGRVGTILKYEFVGILEPFGKVGHFHP